MAYKIAESMWWLAVIAERSDIDLEESVTAFLAKKEPDFKLN